MPPVAPLLLIEGLPAPGSPARSADPAPGWGGDGRYKRCPEGCRRVTTLVQRLRSEVYPGS